MASHTANRLADIGRDGFEVIDRVYGRGASVQAPKKGPSKYAEPQDAPICHQENVLDCEKAAEMYKGVVITDYYKSKNKVEMYKGVATTDYYKSKNKFPR